MTTRPTASPGLVDALRSAVPARIAKRLEAGNPAEAWTWSADGATVTTDGGETVTLGAAPITPDAIRCSCLLSPKCLHVLAVAAALPPASAPVELAAPPVAATGPVRPAAAPGLAEAVRANVPERVRKRLPLEAPPGDAGNPADGWTWADLGGRWTVTTESGDVVTVSGAGPVEPAHLACTCLLSPRCLHVLAVATALSAPAAAPAGAATPAVTPPVAPVAEPKVAIDGGQRSVIGATRRAAIAVLLAGASGVGDTALADLLRAVHGCRAVGLHRLARAGERVRRHVRDLQGRRPSFELAALVEDLSELLLVAHALSAPEVGARWIGTARQVYSPVGTLRLYGLCAEPIITATGAAGVATILCDGQGRVWTVSDVMPKSPPDRARATYDAAVAIGGATLPHRDLCRAGLFAQDATASPEGRIGTGGGIKAVRAGPSAWSDPGPASLFAPSVAAQLDRVGPGGLLFLTGHLLGVHEDALLLGVAGLPQPVRLVPPTDHRELAWRDNLRLLGRAPGLPVRLIGRAVPGRRAVAVIAIGPWELPDADPDGPRLALPPAWVGRCNLGLDGLVSAHVVGLARETAEVPLEEAAHGDPLEPFHRRVARLALGGRGTLPGDARAAVDREIVGLRAAMLPVAGQMLAQLADASAGVRTTGGGEGLATAWLSAAVFARAAKRSLDRAAWGH